MLLLPDVKILQVIFGVISHCFTGYLLHLAENPLTVQTSKTYLRLGRRGPGPYRLMGVVKNGVMLIGLISTLQLVRFSNILAANW